MANLKVSLENIIPLTEARDHFSKIVTEVQRDKLYVLTKGGKPAVAIIDVKYLETISGGSLNTYHVEKEIEKDPLKVGRTPMIVHGSKPTPAANPKPNPSPAMPKPDFFQPKPPTATPNHQLNQDKPSIPNHQQTNNTWSTSKETTNLTNNQPKPNPIRISFEPAKTQNNDAKLETFDNPLDKPLAKPDTTNIGASPLSQPKAESNTGNAKPLITPLSSPTDSDSPMVKPNQFAPTPAIPPTASATPMSTPTKPPLTSGATTTPSAGNLAMPTTPSSALTQNNATPSEPLKTPPITETNNTQSAFNPPKPATPIPININNSSAAPSTPPLNTPKPMGGNSWPVANTANATTPPTSSNPPFSANPPVSTSNSASSFNTQPQTNQPVTPTPTSSPFSNIKTDDKPISQPTNATIDIDDMALD